jgi:hypothetical protein
MEKEKKTTSEKPVSLHPLSFDEALKVLVKIPPKEEKKETKKPSNKS